MGEQCKDCAAFFEIFDRSEMKAIPRCGFMENTYGRYTPKCDRYVEKL